MICHRTLGHTEVAARVVGFRGPLLADGKECIGSRCAMWHRSINDPSRGTCAETRVISPVGPFVGRAWPDPAAKEPT